MYHKEKLLCDIKEMCKFVGGYKKIRVLMLSILLPVVI